MSRIRSWLKYWPVLFAAIFLAVAVHERLALEAQAQGGIDLSREQIIVTVAVTNGSATGFSNPLDKGNFIQLTLNPGDAQVFTYCPPSGACIQVPSGQGYQLGPLRKELQGGQSLGTVQTATDAATLQIVAQRVQ